MLGTNEPPLSCVKIFESFEVFIMTAYADELVAAGFKVLQSALNFYSYYLC